MQRSKFPVQNTIKKFVKLPFNHLYFVSTICAGILSVYRLVTMRNLKNADDSIFLYPRLKFFTFSNFSDQRTTTFRGLGLPPSSGVTEKGKSQLWLANHKELM